MPNLSKHAGFSLVEMMIAIVAGLILVGSTLGFTLSGVRSNTDFVNATYLTQELRGVMDLVTRELKRAGYDQHAIDGVGAGSVFKSKFAPMKFFPTPSANSTIASCVILAYDSKANTASNRPGAIANSERRGIRINAEKQAIEYNLGSTALPDCSSEGANYAAYPPTCNATSGWCALTNPQRVKVTRFDLDTHNTKSIPSTSTSPGLTIRVMKVTLVGALNTDSNVVRSLVDEVRIRADCPLTNCTSVP